MIDHARLSMHGRYGFASHGAITDPVLLAVGSDYENAVMRKMQAFGPDELAQRYAADDPLLVMRKYDGEGVLVYFDNEHCFAFNAPSGRVRIGLPALDEIATRLQAAQVSKALLRCELYLDDQATGDQTRRRGVSDVIRVSHAGRPAETDQLRLAVVDAVMVDGRDLRPQQSQFTVTLELLRRLFAAPGSAQAHVAHCVEARAADLSAIYAREIAAGAEGLVIRRPQRAEISKVKPVRSLDALLIGFVEGDVDGEPAVASLLCALAYGDGEHLQTLVRVGAGLADAERISLLPGLRASTVAAPLAMTDSSGRPLSFVAPQRVLEIHCEDLLSDENQRPLRSQLLRYTATEGYQFVGLTPCPRPVFARFGHWRDDKQWRDGGVRTAQVGLPDSAPAATITATQTQVLRREVYLKGEMLRKLVVIQRSGDLAFPYLVYFTDYSARRAEPLKVTLDVAATQERATELAEQRLAEQITRGFVRQP